MVFPFGRAICFECRRVLMQIHSGRRRSKLEDKLVLSYLIFMPALTSFMPGSPTHSVAVESSEEISATGSRQPGNRNPPCRDPLPWAHQSYTAQEKLVQEEDVWSGVDGPYAAALNPFPNKVLHLFHKSPWRAANVRINKVIWFVMTSASTSTTFNFVQYFALWS